MTTRRIWLSRAFCAAALNTSSQPPVPSSRADLFHFNLTGNRRAIGADDPRLEDRGADNLHKWEITESESLLIGRNFGIGTDIQTGPNGNLFVVSLSNGAVYEIDRR
jgi:hypothetical protein